jgi:hypothetical protein
MSFEAVPGSLRNGACLGPAWGAWPYEPIGNSGHYGAQGAILPRTGERP